MFVHPEKFRRCGKQETVAFVVRSLFVLSLLFFAISLVPFASFVGAIAIIRAGKVLSNAGGRRRGQWTDDGRTDGSGS